MSKKIVSYAVVFCLLFSSIAFAKSNQGGGFVGQEPTAITVEEAIKMADDANVVLRGFIIRSLGNERYEFKDEVGGSVIVEIDNDDWRGLTVEPEDLIIIEGEVDKGWNSIEIDVDRVRKVQ